MIYILHRTFVIHRRSGKRKSHAKLNCIENLNSFETQNLVMKIERDGTFLKQSSEEEFEISE